MKRKIISFPTSYGTVSFLENRDEVYSGFVSIRLIKIASDLKKLGKELQELAEEEE